MKRVIFIFAFCLLSFCAFAQTDVTTFLGIPVDGSAADMRESLISKGFVPEKLGSSEVFKGEFNGTEVQILIVTNNKKVWRLMISDVFHGDAQFVKARFNRLVDQFLNNPRYVGAADQKIDEGVDIEYEHAVNNKRFEAGFYQKPDAEHIDPFLANKVRTKMLEKYTNEQIANPTDEVRAAMEEIAGQVGLEHMMQKTVWFCVTEFHGEYYITMYYDNEYNHANGEDL